MSEQPSRVEGVLLLLDHRGWFTPAPETGDGRRLRLSTAAGESPSQRVRCENCNGSGKLRGGWLCKDCQGRGVYDLDDYTGRIIDTQETSWEELLRGQVACSSCGGTRLDHGCERCGGTGRETALFSGKADLTGGLIPPGPARLRHGDRDLDLLERQHEALAHPSQQALTVCLTRLDPGAHKLVTWVCVDSQERPESLLRSTRLILDWSIAQLAAWMPAEFVSPHKPRLELPGEVWAAWVNRSNAARPDLALATSRARHGDRKAQDRRDKELRSLYASGGYSRHTLARMFGLGYRRVCQITEGVKEAA